MSTPEATGQALDTEIAGDYFSILRLSEWLIRTLGPALTHAADTVVRSRSEAEGCWRGAAADAGVGRLRATGAAADELAGEVIALGREIETYAHAVRIAADRMSDLRVAAAVAGLFVQRYLIYPPDITLNTGLDAAPLPQPMPTGGYHPLGLSPLGTLPLGPLNPATPRPGSPGHVLRADPPAPAPIDRHAAWRTANTDAAFAREKLADAAEALAGVYRGLRGHSWAITAAALAGSIPEGLAAERARHLTRAAADAGRTARSLSAAAAATPIRPGTVGRYLDLSADALRHDELARTAAAHADDAHLRSTEWRGLGATLAVVGVAADIQRGKDPTQAAAAGTAGFAATVLAGTATGAVVGTFIPAPGVATVVGAVVGTGFGIFTAAGVDSLFEDGPDVGHAVSEGLDAVTDTVGALAGGVVSLGKGIGGFLG
ncbi:MAG: hypothetical protein ACT4PP_10280 [Sporichthyaceae bacterium]